MFAAAVCGELQRDIKIKHFISVINQLDAQNFCFTISLFHACTCFEHYVLIIGSLNLYYAASGIVTSIRGRLVHLGTCAQYIYLCN